ncbi:MAG TPA: hypothetical protein PL126_07380 [Candidatus Cloacimonadota bacterium]|nr:hypothetical protein [Candidatus Cloacimonadota bacterium]
MSRFKLISLMIVVLIAVTACVPRLKVSSILPDVVQVAATTDDAAPQNVVEDAHFVQTDDFFVSEVPLADQEYIYVNTAKMLKAPSAESNNQAEFKLSRNDAVIWTRYYQKTRLAKKEDLKVGKEVIFFRTVDDNGHFRAPLNTQEAHSGDWLLSKIEDVSALSQNIVTVSGGYTVNRNNIRVKN